MEEGCVLHGEMTRLSRRRRRRGPNLGLLLAAAALMLGAILSRQGTAQPGGETPEPSATASPGPIGEDWQLRLLNAQHPMGEEEPPELRQLSNGLLVDARCYAELQEMLDACRGEGLTPVVCSAYRSWEKQSELFEEEVERQLARGLSEEEARVEAARAIAAPGTSEHQLGLAVDIVDLDNQRLDETQADTAVQRWLLENSWKYGFVLRYPTDKSDLTGVIYEPWHYRYVGRAAAEEMYERDVCLEEYLEGEPLPGVGA